MKDIPLQVYPVLLLIFTFYGARLSRGGRISDGFLSLEQTHMIQGVACVGIVLHHVTQQITAYGVYDKGPVTLFSDIGFLFTALFFFFSGYGLITSLQTKPDYLDSFLQKRLPSVLVPFWVINALGVLLETVGYGIHTTFQDVLCDIFGLTLINSNGWFIVEITVFYLLFYVIFRLIRNRNAALILLSLSVIAIILFSSRQGHDPQGNQAHWFRGEWWYNSSVTFLFGLMVARFRERLIRFFTKAYVFLLPVSVVAAALFLQRSISCVRRGGYYLSDMSLYPKELTGSIPASSGISAILSGFWKELAAFPSGLPLASKTFLWQSAACIAFTLVVLLLSMRVTLGNRALRFVSTISRELFLIHGYFVFRIFASVRMNDFVRYAVILACSIATAALLSPPIRYLVRAVIHVLLGFSGSLSSFFRSAARAKEEELGKQQTARAARKKRILLTTAALLILAVCILFPLWRSVRSKAEFEAEREAIRDACVGDVILFGRYETDPSKPGKERLPWTVIARKEDAVCLLSTFGIAPGAYHPKHEAVSWEDCDLRRRLNSEEFTGIFSRYEKDLIIPRPMDADRHAETEPDGDTEQDKDKEALPNGTDPTEGDLLTLLSVKELQDIFPEKEDRFCAATQSAVNKGVNTDRVSHHDVWFDQLYCYSWWWLKPEDVQRSSVTAPIVEMDGTIRLDEKAVNKPNGAIRPVVWVDALRS